MELIDLMDTATATVLVALITLIGTLASAYFAFLGRKEARGANRAVNNVRPGMPKLYDMVADGKVDFHEHVALNKVEHAKLNAGLAANAQAHRENTQLHDATQKALDESLVEASRVRNEIKAELKEIRDEVSDPTS